jgi:hypothetical protein
MYSFFSNRFVKQRLAEFLGGESLSQATAVYLTHTDGCQFDRRELRPTTELDWFLERDLDVSRSLADSRSYLLHLDMEYVNFDSPTEAYIDPLRCFELQEPVVRVVESVLLEWGIQPLHLITGQGHHFVWRIGRNSSIAKRIIVLNPAPELMSHCMERIPPILAGTIDEKDQALFAALALLIEFVAHRIKEKAATLCSLPVELTAVHVGPSLTAQREMISVDISEYGDPLYTRMIRMPFTNYRKPWVTGLFQKHGLEGKIPKIRAIPLHEMDFRQAIQVRQMDKELLELAQRACVQIPLHEAGTRRLLDEYLASRLRRFHEYFYSAQHDPKECWPDTYHKAHTNALPGCIQHLLEFSNDLLLKPAGMQMVTRCLLAEGWHPRHIAGLIRAKFENPAFDWGPDWIDYDAATRADFYTRMFSCLYLTGLDRLVDFNCTSTQEKQFCFQKREGNCDLEPYRKILLSKLPDE